MFRSLAVIWPSPRSAVSSSARTGAAFSRNRFCSVSRSLRTTSSAESSCAIPLTSSRLRLRSDETRGSTSAAMATPASRDGTSAIVACSRLASAAASATRVMVRALASAWALTASSSASRTRSNSRRSPRSADESTSSSRSWPASAVRSSSRSARRDARSFAWSPSRRSRASSRVSRLAASRLGGAAETTARRSMRLSRLAELDAIRSSSFCPSASAAVESSLDRPLPCASTTRWYEECSSSTSTTTSPAPRRLVMAFRWRLASASSACSIPRA